MRNWEDSAPSFNILVFRQFILNAPTFNKHLNYPGFYHFNFKNKQDSISWKGMMKRHQIPHF